MLKNFMADIVVELSKDVEKIVKIIPFCDKDKKIADVLEKVLNKEMKYNNEIMQQFTDLLDRATREYI